MNNSTWKKIRNKFMHKINACVKIYVWNKRRKRQYFNTVYILIKSNCNKQKLLYLCTYFPEYCNFIYLLVLMN